MINTVVFDMGNVMREFDPPRILRQLGAPAEDAPVLLREVFGSPEWTALDRGGLTDSQAVAGMCRHLPERLRPWAGRIVAEWWKLPFEGIPGMADLARELKRRGYRVYMLSNAAHTLHDYFPRIPGHEAFDGLFVSSDYRLLKPEPAIYTAFLDKFGLQAEECVFIDDTPANVDGARRVGMASVMFYQDIPRLRRELREAGVDVATDRGAGEPV